jgi:Mlc titration factor MtfA (ptsG expression regulator)
MLPILLPLFIGALLISYILGKPYWRTFQRNKIIQRPFKKQWRKILSKRVPYFRKMPADLQLQLKQHIQVFVEEKNFIGCNGLQINDEVKVTIAAQACLLLLNRKTDIYPKLQTILVYPRAFIRQQQQINNDGLQFTQRQALAGESWEFGKIVLSWEDTLQGAEITDDGHNVVIHEFAHQLDQEDGKANGAPILGRNQNYETWSAVFLEHYELLTLQVKEGTPSLFDYYGATNPAEFFAVASEVFFEQSSELFTQYPKLYLQLKDYYRVDPICW